jgi:hypothetical protein
MVYLRIIKSERNSAMFIKAANGMKYRLVRNSDHSDEWVVVELHAGSRDKTVFHGTKSECSEWIEHNGHDEWN